ncbi:MAG TPA: alkaline phosphatase family protein [Blastocatellia bacterium]|jgi:predicted AlkP superfamily phosphohydrolase/phosphomutase|nr:alkaline phosphatase family protein [Blastocatellia bacterium]
MGLFDKFKSRSPVSKEPSPNEDATKAAKRRAVLLGLDGTPCTLVRRFIEDGTMPNFRRLSERGSLLQMDTAIPDISSVAWTSFMTGANPGRHGIYGFLDLQPDTYKIYFPNSRHIQSETLWDAVGRSGRRSIVINVPSTYPAKALNGVLISGFVAVDLNKATYPPELVPRLREMDYRIDVDARKVQESHDALMDEILTTLDRRVKTLLEQYDTGKWDLFVGVITETDRLQHFFMDAVEDPGHKYHSAFRDFYGRVDNFLGAIAERLGDETLMIMSDHGFTGIKQQVYLNRWLVDNGYLKLKENARSIEEIDEGSRAFAMDPGRIYLNHKGRYPNGTVESADARPLLEEIKRGLSEITSEGAPIVKRVYDRDELFNGPCVGFAPDLCVQPVYGYDLKGAVNKPELMDREIFTGMHTQDDATLYISTDAGSLRSGKPHITDIAPSLLDAMGLPVPQSMDGRSMLARG